MSHIAKYCIDSSEKNTRIGFVALQISVTKDMVIKRKKETATGQLY